MPSSQKILLAVRRKSGSLILHMCQRLLLFIPQKKLYEFVMSLIRRKSASLSSSDSLIFLFSIENKLYRFINKEAVRYGNGVHPKHQHIKYHDFFVRHIEPNTSVLDIGCGVGAVAWDIAQQVPGVEVYGIDISAEVIEQAKTKFSAENITFVCGDARTALPDQQFDIIILSNILEHLEQRVQFLRQLHTQYQTQKFLIRVPLFERNWHIPLQDELGLDYFSDKNHYIEYRQEEFIQEIEEAGMDVIHSQSIWGEIWAEVGVVKSHDD